MVGLMALDDRTLQRTPLYGEFHKEQGHLNIPFDVVETVATSTSPDNTDNAIGYILYKSFRTYGAESKLRLSKSTSFPKIKQLTIQNANPFVIAYIQRVLSMFTNLEDLNIQAKSDDSYPQTSMTSLIHAVQGNTTNLNLNTLCNVPYKELSDAIQLNLSNKEIGSDGAMVIKILLPSTLTKLDISNNQLGSVGASFLADAIKDHTTLENLDISHNNIGNNPIKIGAIALQSMLKKNTVLKEFDISFNELDNTDVSYLAEGIDVNSSLTSVNVLGNNISVEVAQKLAEILKAHPKLKSLCGNKGNETKLDMSGKDLGDIGAILLAPEIAANKELVSVNILGNYIGAEQAQNLVKILEEHKKLKSLCGNTGNETELDMSGKHLGDIGVTLLTPEIVANLALTDLNILGNDISVEQANQFIQIMDLPRNRILKTLCGFSGNETALDLSRKGLHAGCAVLVANEVKNNMALTSLNMSNNGINQGITGEAAAAPGKALADALAVNTVLKELDISSNSLKAPFAEAFAVGLGTNGALSYKTITNASLIQFYTKHNPDNIQSVEAILHKHSVQAIVESAQARYGAAPDVTVVPKSKGALTSLNISNSGIGGMIPPDGSGWSYHPENAYEYMYNHTDGRHQGEAPAGSTPVGVIALADAISTNGALKKVNISNNDIGVLVFPTGWRAKNKSIEGYKYYHSDGRKHNEDPGESLVQAEPKGVVALADAIKKNKALTSLNISRNKMANKEAGKALASMLQSNSTLEELDLSSNHFPKFSDGSGDAGDCQGFAKELAVGLRTNEALVKLDASDNYMFGYGDKSGIQAWADALKTNSSLLELNLAKNYMNADDAKFFADGVSTNEALTSLNISNNMMANTEAGRALGKMLQTNSMLKDLDVSNNYAHLTKGGGTKDGPGFAKELANGLNANHTLRSLNISSNNIGQLVVPDGWIFKKGGVFSASKWVYSDGTKQQRNEPSEPLGVVSIANVIKNNDALTSIDISNNRIGHPALPANTKLKYRPENTDFTDGRRAQKDPPTGTTYPGVDAIVEAIANRKVLATLDIRSNHIPPDQRNRLTNICQSQKIHLHDE